MIRPIIGTLTRWVPCMATVFLSGLPVTSYAQHAGDVLFHIQEGRLTIVNPVTPGDVRKFNVNGDGTVYVTDDPGYNTLRFGTLRSGDEVLFEMATPLYAWTNDSWERAMEGEYLSYYDQPFTDSRFVTATGTSGVSEGYVLEKATALGAIHVHDLFELGTTHGGPPPAGAYAIGKRLLSPQYASSDTFFVVLNNGLSVDVFDQVLASAENVLPTLGHVSGDFDRDGVLTGADIDLLSAAVLNGAADVAAFDLTGDGVVNNDDRKHWVESTFATIFGDANLDKKVDFADFTAVSSAFNGPGGWAQGDFDGNGQVAFGDFVLLSTNYNRTVVASFVPEPSTMPLFAFALVAFGALRCRRTRPHDT